MEDSPSRVVGEQTMPCSAYARTPLMIAVENGNLKMVETILALGAAVDVTTQQGFTALHLAASLGHTVICSTLIEAGASTDAKAEHGVTPLLTAAQNGHVETVRALIAIGVDVNQCAEHGISALHLAASVGDVHAVAALCEAGADVNATTASHVTALEFAAANGNTDTARILCSHGAAYHESAAEQAREGGHDALAELLLERVHWCTPLHHLDAIDSARARALLREGADLDACEGPGCATPYSLAEERHAQGCAPCGSTAWMVLQAGLPWSPETHDFFPDASRSRAVELGHIGVQLALRMPCAKGNEQALLDTWREVVMPHAVTR